MNWTWLFLIGGILIRSLALNQPLVDAHLVRQAQTADWTYHAAEEPGLPLSAEVSWRGDSGARLTLEFPLFNYLALAVFRITGNFDLSGKIVSIILWASSFLVLQRIWERLLHPRQIFWANLLFVLSPLSIFFGQAYMPEMLIQLLAFLILHQLLCYQESASLKNYSLFALFGFLGLLVKSLEISHLYVVALLVFWNKQGLRMMTRPEHWIGGALTLVGYVLWTRYVDSVNSSHFPAWTASNLSKEFLSTWQARLNWHFYVKVGAYIAAFIAGPVGMLVALAGFFQRTSKNQIGFWWVASLLFFYMVWGIRTAGLHSYYNLPALGPLCFLFGLGMPAVLDRIKRTQQAPLIWSRLAVSGLAILIFAPLLVTTGYLFRQDRTIHEVAQWIREQSGPDDLIYLRVNHRRDNNGYAEYPVFSYYAKRRTWIDSPYLTPAERERALATAQWAVITRPPQSSTWAEKIRDKIARTEPLAEVVDWPKTNNTDFILVKDNPRFLIFRKRASEQLSLKAAGG